MLSFIPSFVISWILFINHIAICMSKIRFNANDSTYQITRYVYFFFLFDLPAIICDVIYELKQKCVVNHICKWIRFNSQSNQLSPIKSPITEHDGVLPVKKGIWIVTKRKCENSMIKYLPARGFWVDKLSIYKIRFLLVISVLWKSYLFFQTNKS